MPWNIAEHREAPSAGFDGKIWQFRLSDEDGREVVVLVRISGTAMATLAPALPEATRLARDTAGRTEVKKVLSWFEPPRVIQLGTMSDRALTEGGSPDKPDEAAQVAQIEAWFRERGIELWFDQIGSRWVALMIREGTRVGAAGAGRGLSRFEAARDAKFQQEAIDERMALSSIRSKTLVLPRRQSMTRSPRSLKHG